jgi:hypothetical protein
MRTTIRLDDRLLADAKQLAARTGRTLTDFVSDALRESLARAQGGGAKDRPQLPVFCAGGGLQPGVDLDDSAALLDLMDGDRDPA